jgi:hypothetical protein
VNRAQASRTSPCRRRKRCRPSTCAMLRQTQRAFNVNLPDERVAAKRGDSGAVEDMRHLLEARIVKKCCGEARSPSRICCGRSIASFLGDVELTHVLLTRSRPASGLSARTSSSRSNWLS